MQNKLLNTFYHNHKGHETGLINTLIRKMKVPHFINRKFPEIDGKIKLKSSELKLFIFFWALPLLMHTLPSPFWYLLCQYVLAIRILYEPIKKLDDVKLADELINSYVEKTDQIFGDEATTYTLHAHLHLPKQVLDHGPLHCNSQFCFEV